MSIARDVKMTDYERGCPVVDYTTDSSIHPALTLFKRLDAYQELARPAVWSREAQGYYVLTDHEAILDAFQQSELFSSGVVLASQPDPEYMWIPIMLDEPEHSKWRQLIRAWFTPNRVRSMRAEQESLVEKVVDELETRGECDLVTEFAQILPSLVFLQIMGMPREKLPEFREWLVMVQRHDPALDPDCSIQAAGREKIRSYYAETLADRRANPDPEADDLISMATRWEMDGAQIPEEDILNCMLLLFQAGLDTVAASFGYMMLHLATHPADRQRIVDDPALIPQAVEEMLRVYPVVQTSRKATRDAEFRGCPIKKGDIVNLPLSAAGRDENMYPDAKHVDFDRADNRHLSFGGGPHRCPGAHLARQELAVMLAKWHDRIPHYTLVEQPLEHGMTHGLESLRLTWQPT